MAPLFSCGSWAIYCALRHQYSLGIITTLAVAYTLPGMLFPRRYRVCSAGVVTVVAGFFLWVLVFPLGVLQQHYWPNLAVNPHLCNVPKFFAPFAMILTLLQTNSQTLYEP